MRTIVERSLFYKVWLSMLLLLTTTALATETSPISYRVGIVPQFDARHTHRIWRPILSALEARTGLKFHLVGSPDIPKFEKQFQSGAFDFAYMNPWHVLKTPEPRQYIPLVRDIKRSLHGIIVVAKDSLVTDVRQLDGKKLAFPSRNALGSSLLPRADLQQKFGLQIQPVYVQNHSSVYLNVAMGAFIAGGGVEKTLEQQPRSVQDRLRIIYRTRETASHPFTAHNRVPADIRAKVQESLLELSSSKAGRDLFKEIPITLLGVASHEDYAPIGNWALESLDTKNE